MRESLLTYIDLADPSEAGPDVVRFLERLDVQVPEHKETERGGYWIKATTDPPETSKYGAVYQYLLIGQA